jgi:hypothetical protein
MKITVDASHIQMIPLKFTYVNLGIGPFAFFLNPLVIPIQWSVELCMQMASGSFNSKDLRALHLLYMITDLALMTLMSLTNSFLLY